MDTVKTTVGQFKAQILAAGLEAWRANGGWLLHAVPTDSNTSLCNHTPKNTGRIFHRGCWTMFGATQPCRKCEAKLNDQ